MDSPSNIQDTTEGRVPVNHRAEVEAPFGRPISRERQSLDSYNADPAPTESANRRGKKDSLKSTSKIKKAAFLYSF